MCSEIFRGIKIFANTKYKTLVVVVISTISILVLEVQMLLRFSSANQIELCFTDLLCNLTSIKFFGLFLVPLYLLITMNLINDDFRIPMIIRQGRKEHLWDQQVGKIITISIIVCLNAFLVLWLISKSLKMPLLNWDQLNSMFFYLTKKTIEKNLFGIIPVYWVFNFLMCCFVNISFLFIVWITGNQLSGWILLLAFHWNEAFGFSIFYKTVTLYYTPWLNTIDVIQSLLIPIALIIFICFGGRIYSKLKEFYNAN